MEIFKFEAPNFEIYFNVFLFFLLTEIPDLWRISPKKIFFGVCPPPGDLALRANLAKFSTCKLGPHEALTWPPRLTCLGWPRDGEVIRPLKVQFSPGPRTLNLTPFCTETSNLKSDLSPTISKIFES